ncbi:hypothetical protein DIPPA_06797 [Diplonema papillatum]|nr:hypothetical protein DIPPA_06797 [Diplonema papillatum]
MPSERRKSSGSWQECLTVQLKEPAWWDRAATSPRVEYVYVPKDKYDAVKDRVTAHHTVVVNGEERVVVSGLADRPAADDVRDARPAGDFEPEPPKGCYNCLSLDHPPHRCLRNPVESSPLFLATAHCGNCDGHGHTKAMCKADGGACHGVPGAFLGFHFFLVVYDRRS